MGSRIVLALALVAVVSGCGPRGGVFTPGEEIYTPRHAKGFAIFEGGRHSAAIRITDPWQGARGVEQWVWVSEGGEEPPEGFSGATLTAPPRRIVVMSSSYSAFLAELGAADRIVGVSGGGFITDPAIRERLATGDIAEVGWGDNLDIERIASLGADLALVYGVSSGEEGVVGKLREMSVPCVFVGEYLESSPLGRAEWILAIGTMLGLRPRAEARFSTIERAYDEVRESLSLAGAEQNRPEVMFNAPYRDVWWVPGDDNFMVQMVRDAGGNYVCRGVAGHDSRPLDIEAAWVAMQRVDYWIGTNQYSTLAELLADNPRFAATKPVRLGHVFNNNARTTPAGGSDFWESGVVRPDRALRDLAVILHPDIFAADTTLYYYKKLR